MQLFGVAMGKFKFKLLENNGYFKVYHILPYTVNSEEIGDQ